MNEHFVAGFAKVGTFTVVLQPASEYVCESRTKVGGNVAIYFCTPDGTVLAAAAGPEQPARVLAEARRAVAIAARAEAIGGEDRAAALAQAAAESYGPALHVANGWETWNGGGRRSTLTVMNGGRPAVIRSNPVVLNVTFDENDVSPQPLVYGTSLTRSANVSFNLKSQVLIFTTPTEQVVSLLRTKPAPHLDEIARTVWEQYLGETWSDAPVSVVQAIPIRLHAPIVNESWGTLEVGTLVNDLPLDG